MLYELRMYTIMPGKMPAIQARFRDHTMRMLDKYGFTSIGYWTNMIGGKTDQFVYLIGYPDLETREKGWAGIAADPEWQAAKAESEKDGPLIVRVEYSSVMTPLDFSPLS